MVLASDNPSLQTDDEESDEENDRESGVKSGEGSDEGNCKERAKETSKGEGRDEESDEENDTGSNKESDDEGSYPDVLLPGWASSLIHFPRLQAISIHFSGNMFGLDEELDEDEESPDFLTLEKKWIASWSGYAPSVNRVYLSHTCDDELGSLVEDTMNYRGRNAFWRRKLKGGWTLEAEAENVIWFEDPDMLDQQGDACKQPYEEDGVTVQRVIRVAVSQRKEARKRGRYGLLY